MSSYINSWGKQMTLCCRIFTLKLKTSERTLSSNAAYVGNMSAK